MKEKVKKQVRGPVEALRKSQKGASGRRSFENTDLILF